MQRNHHTQRPSLNDAIEAALANKPGWVEMARRAMEGSRR